MQGEVPKEDLVFGSVILVIFLVVVFAAGYVLNRFKNRQFRTAWRQLVPLLSQPEITEDSGGAATSWLSGSYRGAKVYASMSPKVVRHTELGSTNKGNRFSAAIQNVPGRFDWSLERIPGFPGLGPARWKFQADDSNLQKRLEASSIVSLVGSLGEATLVYRAQDQSLVWTAFIEPLETLPPEQFRITLDALKDVASINSKLNEP